MTQYGIKISKSNFDARTAANKDLLLTSELPSYKVAFSGDFSITIPASSSDSVDYTITHNLGYVPNTIITLEHQLATATRRVSQVFGVTGGEDSGGTVSDDIYSLEIKGTSTIIVRAIPLDISGSDRTFNGYYYVMYEPAQ